MLLSRTLTKLKYSNFRFVSCSQNSKMDDQSKMKIIKSCIPPLDNSNYKGQAGRIGVVGGSLEYTGAPYFAGISALRVRLKSSDLFCVSLSKYMVN